MYIVTGGAGLIGSSMIWHLNNCGIKDILVVDHLGDSDKWKNLRGLKYTDYIEKDDFLKDIVYKNKNYDFDGVFHMGACSSTNEKDMSYLIKNNFEYSKEVSKYCFKNGIRLTYASSCATYGDGANGYVDSEDYEYLNKLKPLNAYGYSKHMFDLWNIRSFNSHAIGVKFSNIYGCNERHKGEMRSVVLKGYEQIKKHGYINLFKSYKEEYADGEQMRDFLYVKDAVKMVYFLYSKGIAGLYNVGSGKAESWNNLASCIFKALNKEVNIQYIDMPEDLREHYQYYTCTDISKLIECGYDKKIMSMEDAIKDYVYYLENNIYLGEEKEK